MSFWNSIQISGSGLSAQRMRLDIISNNIANAQTTHTAAGGAYKRQDVVFTPQGGQSTIPSSITSHIQGLSATPTGGVQVASIITDQTPGQQVYDPTNPDANAQGYVTMPNVDLVTEMTNLLSATRSYEANLSVVEASKQMALKSLDIGK